jgi:hypothetical protein
MKHLSRCRTFLLFSLLCASSASFAQDILWEKSYGGKHADYLFDAVPTADYGFILAGSSLSVKSGNKTEDNRGDLDYWIWKMDEKGDLDWQKSFGGTGMDMLHSIRLTADGGFILAGTSNSPKGLDKKDDSRGGNDFWIIKLDAGGGEQWQKTIGGAMQDDLVMVSQTRDGGFILGGNSASDHSREKDTDSRGSMDYWIVKLDKKGTVEWQKTYGGQYADMLKSISQTKDSGYIVGGYSNSPMSGDKSDDYIGTGDYWILKLDDKGGIEWQKTYGGDKDDQLATISQTLDGGYIVGGNSNSGSTNGKKKSNEKGTDFWVLKLDENGDSKWQETYNFGEIDILTTLSEKQDGTYLIGGFARSELSAKEVRKNKSDKKEINDYIAMKINANGEEIWKKSVGSSGEDILRKLLETRDGGYLLAGTSNSKSSRDKNTNIGRNDFWVVKLKDEKKLDNPQVIEAIPNPAGDFTNVIVGYEYTKGQAIVYDLAGHELRRFPVSGRTIPVNLSGFPEGIYIVNVRTDKSVDSVKVIKGL